MKFHTDRKAPPFLNRREQYRLLALVAVLCLVMAAIQWAARPSSWHWLLPPSAEGVTGSPSLEEIDFRVQQHREPLAPDTFRAVTQPEADRTLTEPVLDTGEETFVDIPADLLDPIEDNTLGLRRKERDAYQLMLSRIRDLPEKRAATQSREDVAFTVLMLHPDEYRGKLLTVRGELRRLTKLPISSEVGFDALYEGWLFTRDSGTNPYRIVCSEKPANVPLSESLDPPLPVRVTGYFFKRYGYVSQGGQHVAPMLIAKRPTLLPRPPVTPADGPELHNFMLGLIGIVIVAVASLALWFFLSDRRFRGSRLDQLAAARLDATPQDLEALQQVETIDPERLFEPSDATSAAADASPSESSPPVK